jgi:nucleoside phosphorylase
MLSLRDSKPVSGCRAARGTAGNIDVYAIESGPAKARAAAATVAGFMSYSPDLVVDTGSCAGTEPGAFVGQLILCRDCYEYDIGGSGFPSKVIPEMKLPSAVSSLPSTDRETLLREAGETGSAENFQVHVGNQACGELLIHSQQMREALNSLFQASGANWETAGVFIGALQNSLPPLSIRIATDLGNEQALNDFRANIKKKARELYRYVQVLAEYGWFDHFLEFWQKLDSAVIDKLPQSVLP